MIGLLLQQPPRREVPHRGGAAWTYRKQQVEGAGPLERILLVYDAALGACARQDLSRVLEALSALRAGLDFSGGGEIASRLLSLYLYCEEKARRRQFGETERILRELRGAWAQCAGAA
jgi:flagellin-specific chaperone FliS